MSDDAARIDRLLAVMAALRRPETGCPWDIEQTFATIAPYTIEEAYEVADAIERGDLDDLRGELGDLLFQVVFHARMAEEAGAFAFGDVVEAITDKMIRRHPHVFGDVAAGSIERIWGRWEEIKAAERRQRQAKRGEVAGLLDDVPAALPALSRSAKLQKRAASVGFDWPAIDGVWEKLREELRELDHETADVAPAHDRVADELGDVLFTAVNLARHLKVDPEEALRQANAKFARRFAAVEQKLRAAGIDLKDASAELMDETWKAVKADEEPSG